MATHAFESTGEAYDACQCDDGIANGDLLDIEPEGVVGLAWTWPVAVTARSGELHGIDRTHDGLDRVSGDAGWTQEQIEAAVALATERGYPVAEAFAGHAPAGPTP